MRSNAFVCDVQIPSKIFLQSKDGMIMVPLLTQSWSSARALWKVKFSHNSHAGFFHCDFGFFSLSSFRSNSILLVYH